MPAFLSPGISKYYIDEEYAENRMVIQEDGTAHAKVLKYKTV